MKLRIGILGTRGIPNNYGGFEQISAYLAQGLVQRGHEVTVYNGHKHPYQLTTWRGINIVHCHNPEHWMGMSGQFVYDLNCILDARKRSFDAILIMGYTSSSVWGKLYPRDSVIISNMDGLEWMRTKYSKPVQRFLQFAEKLAVKFSDNYIADSLAIQKYLRDKYDISPAYIPYAAEIMPFTDDRICNEFRLIKHNYMLLIARMEPENNIDTILSGFTKSSTSQHMVVVGDTANKHGRHLVNIFRNDKRILFAGPVFDTQKLHSLRSFSSLYFHGHSVGGTNPSLLEAMASKVYVVAHDNAFNRQILEKDASYFNTALDIKKIIEEDIPAVKKETAIEDNFNKIIHRYNWDRIVAKYEQFILSCCNSATVEEHIYHPGYIGK
ncbi:DUF1972 domain-containing protein [Danxiaibacter flavus]|uniref:DUF1972 domain-containing protein n=1 Tax=Danxiaibacter flavus TaxID=3049108 RepID=A0ABV3ZAY1_9BACT|nr:DUF1972 domain-containing protein [Chitinophagaceae bacterium DXS]